MALRQLRYHDNSGTTWLCDGVWRTQVVTSGGISQANQINALLQDVGNTEDKRGVGPPASVYVIQALKNADAVMAGLSVNAVTLDGYDDKVAEQIWNTPADDPIYSAVPVSEDNVAPDDDCAWADG
jgi:hypothetical protein